MAKAIPQIYKHEFIEKMETLFPEQYYLDTYYQNPYNMYQYIMRNSRGYFHVKEIIHTKYGYTINHYRIDKSEKIIDTGDRYGFFKTLPEIKKLIWQYNILVEILYSIWTYIYFLHITGLFFSKISNHCINIVFGADALC